MVHLKRHMMPKFWPVKRKGIKWVVRPSPGPHKLNLCIPAQIVVRDALGFADSAEEARKIIKAGKMLVDKKVRKDPKYPVGLMDAVEFPDAKKYYRVVVNKNGLTLTETDLERTKHKLCMIRSKVNIRGGLFQLGLHDGRNILTKDKKYRPGDSIVITLPDQKIIKHLKLEKGNKALIVSGRNIGTKGIIKDIYNRKTMVEESKVILDVNGKTIETPKDFILIIDVPGTEKIDIKTEEEKPAGEEAKKSENKKSPKKKEGKK